MTKEEIISVLAELYKITGFRVSLHSADYSEIAAYPAEKRKFCRMVHKDPAEYEKCVACDKAHSCGLQIRQSQGRQVHQPVLQKIGILMNGNRIHFKPKARNHKGAGMRMGAGKENILSRYSHSRANGSAVFFK